MKPPADNPYRATVNEESAETGTSWSKVVGITTAVLVVLSGLVGVIITLQAGSSLQQFAALEHLALLVRMSALREYAPTPCAIG